MHRKIKLFSCKILTGSVSLKRNFIFARLWHTLAEIAKEFFLITYYYMHILGINCSHRKTSNSELFLDYLLKSLSSNFSVEKVNLLDLKIDCRGCESCFSDFRNHDDDLVGVHEKMLKANVIIMSSPTYFGMPSNLAKVLMDRTNSIWLEKGLKGKMGAVIVNGASRFGAIEQNAKNIVHFFHDHEVINVPFYTCFNNSIKHPHERFPDPLPKDLTDPLDKLSIEIKTLADIISPNLSR